MSNWQNYWFARSSESLSNSLNTMCTSWELPHIIFFGSQYFEIKYCKKFHCHLHKISLHYQTMIDQRLTALYQLFSWTLQMSDWQNDQFPSSDDNLKSSLTSAMYRLRFASLKILSKWIIFQIRHCKKVNCLLNKFCLHSLTASCPKAGRNSPTVQVDFS